MNALLQKVSVFTLETNIRVKKALNEFLRDFLIANNSFQESNLILSMHLNIRCIFVQDSMLDRRPV